VFTAFKQTDSGLRQGSGTGLGMPITLKLVEAHQGTIWFESQPGEGTTFYIDLPLVSALEPERAQ
jgi:signal transduction histidine kinase